MKFHKILLVALLFLVGCNAQSQYIDSQYSDPQLWYREANTPGDKAYDIFYLLPTCVWDRVDANGDTIHYADPLYAADREKMRSSFELAQQIFGGDANFYSPYYHQTSLQSGRSDSIFEARFPRAFADVKQAFDYYMNEVNNGRPFVLAGFSQGGKCVVELLKTLNAEQYRQLIAAYVVGYRVTTSDTTNYKQIKPAKGEKDAGVTICYNSMSHPEAACPALSPSAICINPLNWSTTSEPAQLNDTVTIRVNNEHNVLIVDGLNPDKYYSKSLEFLFKKGNYHLQELNFYRKSLSDNVKARFETYKQGK